MRYHPEGLKVNDSIIAKWVLHPDTTELKLSD